jgi:hypothetical protein
MEGASKRFPGTSSRGDCGFIVSMVSSCFHIGDDAISDYDFISASRGSLDVS